MALLNSGRAEALGEGVNYGSQSREQLSDALLGSALRGTYLTQQRHHHHHHLAFPQSTTAAGVSASSSDVTVLSEGGHSGAESELGGGDYSMHHGDLTAVLQQPHLIQGKGGGGGYLECVVRMWNVFFFFFFLKCVLICPARSERHPCE